MVTRAINRQEAMALPRTAPYPEERNGLKKFRDETWINGLYGQPSEEGARKQLAKNLSQYEMDLEGFYCSGGIHTGVFMEYDPVNGYGKEKVTWKYYIHFARYR